MNKTVARIRLLNAPFHIDRSYDYFIPGELREAVRSGSFVVVPFGASNRRERAVVTGLAEGSTFGELKPVLAVVNESFRLTREMLKLADFIREHTFCTYGDAVRAMLPTASGANKIGETITPVPGVSRPEDLNETEALVLDAVSGKKKLTEDDLRERCGENVSRAVRSLAARGLVTRTLTLREPKSKQIETIFPAKAEEEIAAYLEKNGRRSKKQALLLRSLSDLGPMNWETVRDSLSVPRSAVEDLLAAGMIRSEKRTLWRDPYREKDFVPLPDVVLSPAQDEALRAILPLICGEPRAALLHGVTGSGKTSVVKKVIDEVLSRGKSVILLVPEIGLTPQTVDFFRGYYAGKIAVIHSMLSDGERFDAWQRMKSGEAALCIGTRSAVFAPFDNLGAIIIDEEQEHTYKSDQTPKYHARDVARFRCAEQGALMLLASATPSPESYEKAITGKYTLVPLTERYGNAALPEAVLVDTRADAKEGNLSPIGSVLKAELAARLEKGEQSILFLNRRGYHNFLSCPLCGEAILCPHCSVSLTYHTRKKRFAGEETSAFLFCHYCGYRAPVPHACPSCGSPDLRRVGCGTQKVEEELKNLFPAARVLRMDADTTAMKFSADALLDSFRKGEADILVGTQMVTKGHDFPNVTLVGVISADSSLYLDDFRAGERTFSLITQVIGRAGRGDKPGKALIQTSNPDHPLLRLSCSQDYGRFFREEEAMRRALTFPPFCDIVVLTFSSVSEQDLMTVCVSFDKRMKELLSGDFSDVRLQSFGPMEAPVYRVSEVCRMRILVKCRTNPRTRLFFRTLLDEFTAKVGKKVSVSADVNPTGI
ncbi:MAG: primosomal protein N' [Lachnospiraceae bacterium]|nr:primosomal protein N' [Lachnospiraceae bacterium]